MTRAATSTRKKTVTQKRAGTWVTCASWSASDSGIRPRLRRLCNSKTGRTPPKSRNQTPAYAKIACTWADAYQETTNTIAPVISRESTPNRLRMLISMSSSRTTVSQSSSVIRFPPSSQAPSTPISDGAI